MTDIFHETKRERKFYEDKKQKALKQINYSIASIITNPKFSYGKSEKGKYFVKVLKNIYEKVNDI